VNITPEGNSDADASAAFQFPGSGGGRPKKNTCFFPLFSLLKAPGNQLQAAKVSNSGMI